MLRPLVLATALTVVRGFVLRVPVLPRHNSIGGAAGVLAATQRNCASYTKAELPNIDGTGSLRTLVTYPAIMDIKAIGETVNDDSFVKDMQKLAAEAAPAKPVEVRWRDKGRFRSVTLRCTFRTADEVYALYALLDEDARVMFKL